MSKKNGILAILTLCIWGFAMLSCTLSFNFVNPDNTVTGRTWMITDEIQKKTIQQAFAEVVPILHAPYDKGDLFFRIFRGDTEINESMDGVKSAKVGNGMNIGGGTWTVKAGKDNTAPAPNVGAGYRGGAAPKMLQILRRRRLKKKIVLSMNTSHINLMDHLFM